MEQKTIFQSRCSANGVKDVKDNKKTYIMQLDKLDNKLSVIFSLLALKSRDIKRVILKSDNLSSEVDLSTKDGYRELFQKAIEAIPECPINPVREETETLSCQPDATIPSDVLGVTFFCLAAKARGEKICYQYNKEMINSEELPNNFADALSCVVFDICDILDIDERIEQLYEKMNLPKDFDFELPIGTRKK